MRPGTTAWKVRQGISSLRSPEVTGGENNLAAAAAQKDRQLWLTKSNIRNTRGSTPGTGRSAGAGRSASAGRSAGTAAGRARKGQVGAVRVPGAKKIREK